MNHQRHTNSDNSQDEFDWERGLEQLREQRNAGQNKPAKASATATTPKPEAKASSLSEEVQLNHTAAEKLLREYLQQWQKEHNDPLADTMTAETDATVLLQEDWLAAQTALQSARIDDSKVQSTRTVWLNPKRQNVAFENPIPEQPKPSSEEEGTQEHPIEEAVQPEEWLPVTVKVINPQADPRKPVLFLSEQELLEHLTRRLRPHLTDAVAGMVRVAIQKQAAALTYQLQQILHEQTPALVDEILEHNLKAVMSDIKYSLKYKR
ncbi:hypothetical protein [Neisseria montereyensis]|uniref:Uncharacterized protein n=1 Tax=Neisseria montereyensis TaxID=2973938 RepID=A0ABT2FA07_9NEIS|nr:hypothetical protein [Neisseria montereyensis]MCS4532982.1 hypothetical protein [Neisseria montereyensis]